MTVKQRWHCANVLPKPPMHVQLRMTLPLALGWLARLARMSHAVVRSAAHSNKPCATAKTATSLLRSTPTAQTAPALRPPLCTKVRLCRITTSTTQTLRLNWWQNSTLRTAQPLRSSNTQTLVASHVVLPCLRHIKTHSIVTGPRRLVGSWR